MNLLYLLLMIVGTTAVYQNSNVGFFPSLLIGGMGSCFLAGLAWGLLKQAVANGISSATNPKIKLKDGRSGFAEVTKKGQLVLDSHSGKELIEGVFHLRKIGAISDETSQRMLNEIYGSTLNIKPLSKEESDELVRTTWGEFGRKSEMHFAVLSEAGLITEREQLEIENFIERQHSGEAAEDELLGMMAAAADNMKRG